MAYNTREIKKDIDGNPVSQYFNTVADEFEVVEGASGANKVIVEDNSLSLIPILDKLTQLTGTIIDEETRKSNELLRIALYENIDNLLTTGQLKGDKGNTGNGLEFNWNGTELGIRVEGELDYVYVQLKGEKGEQGIQGETGSIESLDSSHVVGALGFTPANNDDLVSHKAENVHQYEELKFSELSSIATNVDSEGIYVNSEWKRADNTTYAKSTLLGTTPNYNQIKIDYYDKLGTSIIKTITWNLTYDGNDFAYQREVV